MQNYNKKWLFLLVLSLIWGTSFILIKKGLTGLTPMQLGALRIVAAGLFLFLAGFKTLKGLTKKTWLWLTVSGFLGTFFPAFLFAIAETEIDSAIASILNSLVPLSTIIIGALVFKISSSKRQFFGVIIGLLGTFMLILKGAQLNPDQNYLYAGFVITATLMYAFNVNIIKKYLAHVHPLGIAIANFVAIMIPAIVVLFTSGFFKAETMQHHNFNEAVIYVIILAFFGTALAKVFFNKLVQIATPVFASSVTYIMPIVALTWGLLDREKFSFYQALASGVILLGVYLANKQKT